MKWYFFLTNDHSFAISYNIQVYPESKYHPPAHEEKSMSFTLFWRQNRPYRILHLLTSLCLIVIVSMTVEIMASESNTVNVPADFQLYLESAPLKADPDFPAESLKLTAAGNIEFSAKRVEEGKLPPANIQVGKKAIKEIYAQVQRQGFFKLRKDYFDPAVLDGDYAQLTITANGKTHTVRTTNIAVEAFDAIVHRVNRYMPPARNIYYNALHVKSYKRVPR